MLLIFLFGKINPQSRKTLNLRKEYGGIYIVLILAIINQEKMLQPYVTG
jgi:hypothetical protein